MLNVVDAVGDRVGEEEFHELEEQRNLKQSVKKFGKSKDMRIGLLMLLSTLTRATGMANEGEGHVHEGVDWGWMALCTCAVLGALSLMKWLRVYVIEIFDGAKDILMKCVEKMMESRKVTMTWRIMVEERETQTTAEVTNPDLQKCSKELEEAHLRNFHLDTYIEELEEKLRGVQEVMDDFMIQTRLSASRATKVENQLCNLRMTANGRAVHFSPKCKFWERAQEIQMCKTCTQEGGVTNIHGGSHAHT